MVFTCEHSAKTNHISIKTNTSLLKSLSLEEDKKITLTHVQTLTEFADKHFTAIAKLGVHAGRRLDLSAQAHSLEPENTIARDMATLFEEMWERSTGNGAARYPCLFRSVNAKTLREHLRDCGNTLLKEEDKPKPLSTISPLQKSRQDFVSKVLNPAFQPERIGLSVGFIVEDSSNECWSIPGIDRSEAEQVKLAAEQRKRKRETEQARGRQTKQRDSTTRSSTGSKRICAPASSAQSTESVQPASTKIQRDHRSDSAFSPWTNYSAVGSDDVPKSHGDGETNIVHDVGLQQNAPVITRPGLTLDDGSGGISAVPNQASYWLGAETDDRSERQSIRAQAASEIRDPHDSELPGNGLVASLQDDLSLLEAEWDEDSHLYNQ